MKRKIFAICTAGAAAFFLFALAVNGLVIRQAQPHISEQPDGVYDCILVFGCKVYGDKPSAMLRDRLDRAIELYQAGASDRLLMSGDHGRADYDEVHAMKQYALAQGVPEEAIFLDHAGFSTYESVYRAQAIFGVRRALLVTQPYHLYRAVYDARRLGLEADGAAAAANPYYRVYNNLREILARNKDFLFTIVKPEPTCLGEKIPICLSGLLTEDTPEETAAETKSRQRAEPIKRTARLSAGDAFRYTPETGYAESH